MTRHASILTLLLAGLMALALVACEDKKEDTAAEEKEATLSTTSPDLCDHIIEVGDEQAFDHDGCIMRLDGLQIQLGDEAWSSTHGKCLAEAQDGAAVEACLSAADQAALDKASQSE